MLSACVWPPSIRGRLVHSLICSPFLDPHVLLPGGWPGGLWPVLCPDRGTALLKPPLYMSPPYSDGHVQELYCMGGTSCDLTLVHFCPCPCSWTSCPRHVKFLEMSRVLRSSK